MQQVEAALFDAVPFALLYFDATMKLQWANRQAHLLWGDTALMGSPQSAVAGSMGVDEATLHQVATTNTTALESIRLERAGEEVIYLDLTYTPVQDGGGILVSAADVTARERELAELRQQAVTSEVENVQFNTILDHMSENVLLVEASGQIRYLNAAGRALAGVSPDETLTNTTPVLNITLQHLDGTLVTAADHPITKTLQGESLSDVELYYTSSDGNLRLLSVDGAAVRDESGAVRLAVITARDITTLRQLEMGYKAKSEELQGILDNLTEGVLVADSSGRQVYLNHAGRILTGLADEQELPDLSTYQRPSVYNLDGQMMGVADYPISRALQGEVFTDVPLYFRSSSGRTRLLSCSGSSIKNENGSIRLGISVFRDITRQHELERQLQERSDELQAVLDNLPDGVVLIEPDGRIRYRNPAHLRMLGAKDGKELPPSVYPLDTRLVDGRELSAEEYPASRTAKGEVFSGFELSFTGDDGQRRLVSYSGNSVRDAQGNVRLGILLGHDVTAEREIDRLKDEFISITSHELRTPLTTIKGYSQVITRKLRRFDRAIQEELDRPLATILERTERMIAMVNDLLDVSRIAAGRFEVNPEMIDLTATVANCAEELTLTTTLPLDVQVPDEPVLAQGDKRLVEQVLSNLINNAIKYNHDNGMVRVTLTCTANMAQVSVSDQGIGIAREEQAFLFERFYRSKQGQNKAAGLGLGLYISAGIIKAHGGRIWVDSEGEGKGATFTFTLPLYPI